MTYAWHALFHDSGTILTKRQTRLKSQQMKKEKKEKRKKKTH